LALLEVSGEKRAAQVRLQVIDSANTQSFGEAQHTIPKSGLQSWQVAREESSPVGRANRKLVLDW